MIRASSHREAPLIADDPLVTIQIHMPLDRLAMRFTLIACYVPGQLAQR